MAKLCWALAIAVTALPNMAMAQNGSAGIDIPGVNCSMPNSYCSSTKTTITVGSDGETKTTEKTRTIGGKPVEDDDAPNARRVIQPKRDDSAMPGMHFDPALGYYVPNTPAPIPAAKPAPAGPETAPNSFGFGEPAIKPYN
jgi:hypothetical protein